MTLRLFIDTTLCGASIAFLSKENGTEASWTGFHSERGDADSAICRMVDEGLQSLSKNAQDIDSIIVSHGPGSFTGIKVGLAWAYGFQAARKENLLVGLSSLAEGNSEIQLQLKKKSAILFPISKREVFLCWQNPNLEYGFSSLVLFSESAEIELKKRIAESCTLHLVALESKVKEWTEKISGSSVVEMQMIDFMKLAMQGMIRKSEDLNLETLKQRVILPQYLKKTSVEEKFAMGDQNV